MITIECLFHFTSCIKLEHRVQLSLVQLATDVCIASLQFLSLYIYSYSTERKCSASCIHSFVIVVYAATRLVYCVFQRGEDKCF